MELYFYYIEGRYIDGQYIFEKKVAFDETYFMNIINSEKSENYRNQRLLNIAQNLMVPLHSQFPKTI